MGRTDKIHTNICTTNARVHRAINKKGGAISAQIPTGNT